MGIERLLWVPDGATANDGAYVLNDAKAILAILAIESHRHRCMVIGEDLGTVPSGFRERMAAAGLYAMSVVLFERDGPDFRPSDRYAAQSIASFGTHDLPPFHGWWRQNANDEDGKALQRAMGAKIDGATENAKSVSIRLHHFLASTPAKVALVQFDDPACEEVPVNVPGTTSERPNWRRRMKASVRDIFSSDHGRKLVKVISQGRNNRSK